MGALFLGASCDGDADGQVGCVEDSACGAGQVCVVGLCLDPGDQRLRTVDIEVDATAAGVPMQSVFDVDLGAAARVDVQLAPSVVAEGAVVADESGVPAFVLARPARAIAGRGLAPSASGTADGLFTLTLVEGARYALTAVPADLRYPPLYDDRGFSVPAAPSGVLDLPPLLVPDTIVRVAGVVQAGSGVEALAIEELDVRMVDDAGRVWSSTARTGPDGRFTVALSGPRDDLTLEVTPTARNPMWPRVRLSGVDVGGDLDLGVVSLGAVVAPRPVVARVVDNGGAPQAGATVVLTAQLGAGTFTHRAVTLADGRIDARIPPGRYDMVVVPPAGVESGGLLFVDDVELPASGSALRLALPARVPWSGRVLDADGELTAGATLVVTRVGDERGRPEPGLADLPLTVELTSDNDGTFRVALDPGRYRVYVQPRPGSGLPATSALLSVGTVPLRRDIELPARALVAGAVQLRGAGVQGAWVRVYSAIVDEVGSAILLGEGPTAADGHFDVVVPDLGFEDATGPTP